MEGILIACLVLLPMLASPAVYPLRRHSQAWRNHFVRTLPLIELACAAALILFPDAQLTLPGVCGLGLHFAAGSLRTLLVVTACFLWAMTGLNSPAYFAHAEGCNRYYCFWLLTQGALMGVFLAADLFTLFVFFEMMSFTSYVWVVQNETEEALRAGGTYLAVAVIGGMTLLVGLLLLQDLFGTLEISQLRALAEALPAERRTQL